MIKNLLIRFIYHIVKPSQGPLYTTNIIRVEWKIPLEVKYNVLKKKKSTTWDQLKIWKQYLGEDERNNYNFATKFGVLILINKL